MIYFTGRRLIKKSSLPEYILYLKSNNTRRYQSPKIMPPWHWSKLLQLYLLWKYVHIKKVLSLLTVSASKDSLKQSEKAYYSFDDDRQKWRNWLLATLIWFQPLTLWPTWSFPVPQLTFMRQPQCCFSICLRKDLRHLQNKFCYICASRIRYVIKQRQY